MTLTAEQCVKDLTNSHARHIIEVAIGEVAVPPLLVIYGKEPGDIQVQEMEFTEDNRPPDVLYRAGRDTARQGFTPMAISLAVETWMQSIDVKEFERGKIRPVDTEIRVERLMVATLDWRKHSACEIYDIERDEQGRFTAFPPVNLDQGHFKVRLLEHFYQGFAETWRGRTTHSTPTIQ